jgi:hypothetical protein
MSKSNRHHCEKSDFVVLKPGKVLPDRVADFAELQPKQTEEPKPPSDEDDE